MGRRAQRPVTPDGRYNVGRGQLRRNTNPNLDDRARKRLIKLLMRSRIESNSAKTSEERARLNTVVRETKIALGESGPVWWDDGEPDFSGAHPTDTPYRDWWESLDAVQRSAAMA